VGGLFFAGLGGPVAGAFVRHDGIVALLLRGKVCRLAADVGEDRHDKAVGLANLQFALSWGPTWPKIPSMK